ncbi:MAG: UDP-N-acetylmuramyl-tripeptide synthetase [Polyangiaceae bacterium]
MTTTAHLVRRAIDAAEDGPTTGILGTVGHVYRDFAIAASHTTPESDEVARVMAVMAKRGAKNVVMEVSSIAVSEGRVDGVHFRVAAFTNFTQDHLDYHGTMEAYGAAKARLFHELAPGTAVVCVDSPFGATLADDVETRHVHGVVRVSTSSVPSSAGTSGRHVDFAPIDVTFGPNGIEGRVHTPRGIVPLRSPLVGRHNLENLLVTLGVVHALDLDVAKAARALADEIGAPGRLERVSAATDDVTVLVDYAHTPDALERVLDAVRGVSSGALLCVFGCGGDRDAKKRAPMGEAAGNRATASSSRTSNYAQPPRGHRRRRSGPRGVGGEGHPRNPARFPPCVRCHPRSCTRD